MTLNITGGGAATLNAGDSGVSVVNLQSSPSAYTFTTNAEAGLVINDQSAGGDTVVPRISLPDHQWRRWRSDPQRHSLHSRRAPQGRLWWE